MFQKYKLYIWHNVRRDYTAGIAFAVARDIEEARNAIKDVCQDNRQWEWDTHKGELINEPEVRDIPSGDWISGGG